MAAGASYVATVNATVGATIATGSYTVIAKADSNNAGAFYTTNDSSLAESNETNNTITAPVTLPARPDLSIAPGTTVGTITVNADGSYSIPVTFIVQNLGGSPAKGGWYDECYLSTNSVLDTSDDAIGYVYRASDLAASGQYTISTTCRTATATTAGSYTLFVKADGYDSGGKYNNTSLLFESDETNNTASTTITLPTKP